MFWRYILKTVKVVAVFTLTIFIIRTFIVEPGRVNGRSMEPTYFDNQLFFVNKAIYFFSTPQRGDVIQFIELASGKTLIKRVIGLPGEQVTIKQNAVFITDQDGTTYQLTEDYLYTSTVTDSVGGNATNYGVIEPWHYFVLGDNRTQSHDSRNFGVIDRSTILGKIIEK